MITPGTRPGFGSTIEDVQSYALTPEIGTRRESDITGVIYLPVVAFASEGAEIRGTIRLVTVVATWRIRSTGQESD